MNRRELLLALAAGGVGTVEGLWMPGTKLISIPKRPANWSLHPSYLHNVLYKRDGRVVYRNIRHPGLPIFRFHVDTRTGIFDVWQVLDQVNDINISWSLS